MDKETWKLAGKKDETFKAFKARTIEEQTENIRQAAKRATKDPEGKPILHTVLRSVARSGMSRVIHVGYIDEKTGQLRQLNYAASVVLDCKIKQTDTGEGVYIYGCGMDMGFHLVHSLGLSIGDGYLFTHRWI